MNILVTGSSGFIGKNIYLKLKNKYKVTAPSSSELNLLDSSKVKSFIIKNKFDVIIHAATWNATANSNKNLNLVYENNLLMFNNLISQENHYGHLFSLGSGAEFSRLHYKPLMSEHYLGENIPTDPYGKSKYDINNAILKSNKATNLRLFGVFGPYEDWEIRFISNAICKTLHGLDITIRQDVIFDYLYIDDLVKIIEQFLNKKSFSYKDYNITTASPFKLSYYAELILKSLESNTNIIIGKKGLGLEYSGNNKRLLSELPIVFSKPQDNINKLINFYKENISKVDRSLLLYDKTH